MELPNELVQLATKPREFIESSRLHPVSGRVCGEGFADLLVNCGLPSIFRVHIETEHTQVAPL